MYSIDLDDLIIRTENLINLNTTSKPKPSPVMSQRSYRKVRPEPVNEKSLVGSVVNFIHDYVGADKQGSPLSGSNQTSSQNELNVPNEVKEQIEWLHFEPYALARSGSQFSNSNIILVLGYKTGYSVWSIDMDGTATETLSVREPNINNVKLIQCENEQKLLLSVCKYCVDEEVAQPAASHDPSSILNFIDDEAPSTIVGSSHSNPSNGKKNIIMFVNLITGECLKEIVYDGLIIDLKSNADFLCVNSFNRIDAFDLVRFEHQFSIETCYSQISNSTGNLINPIALGHRWIAFADNK
ncbi:breast carcinoma-amplified sequence, partial [Brachionus plicatilis]